MKSNFCVRSFLLPFFAVPLLFPVTSAVGRETIPAGEVAECCASQAHAGPENSWRSCAEPPDEPPQTPKPSKPPVLARMRMNPPVAPKLGEPINDLALASYLEREAGRLVEQGLTLTNWPDLKEKKNAHLKLPRAGSKAKTRAALTAQLERAVVVVGISYLCDRCTRLHLMSAAGFFISEDGALATCWHVLDVQGGKPRGIVAMTRDGRVLPIKGVLASDEFNDLVVLQTGVGDGKDKSISFTALPLAAAAPTGAPVSILSHPDRHFFLFTQGIVSREIAERRGGGLREQVCVTAEFAKGSSGAPVVDETGAVIGIVNNTQSIYYNVTRDEQKDFQMTVRNCTPGRVLQRLCTPQVARKST